MVRARCPAPSGSPARGSTTPSTWSATATHGRGRPVAVPRAHRVDVPPVPLAGARARGGTQGLGVTKGDRVVAYLPNSPRRSSRSSPASLGAVWASVSPEFGLRSVIDRFGQIEPKVLIAVEDYAYAAGRRPLAKRSQRSAAGCRRSSSDRSRLPEPDPAGSHSSLSRSTIRCTSCSRRAPRGPRRRSSTATAASSSSTSRTSGCPIQGWLGTGPFGAKQVGENCHRRSGCRRQRRGNAVGVRLEVFPVTAERIHEALQTQPVRRT